MKQWIKLLLLCSGTLALTANALALDSDGDGIVNTTDLDDDNDGILDAQECSSKVVVFLEDFNGYVSQTTSVAPLSNPNEETEIPYQEVIPGAVPPSGWYAVALQPNSWFSALRNFSENAAMSFDGSHSNSGEKLVFKAKNITLTSGNEYEFSFKYWAENTVLPILSLYVDEDGAAGPKAPQLLKEITLVGGGYDYKTAVANWVATADNSNAEFYIMLNNHSGGNGGRNFQLDDIKLEKFDCDLDGDGIPNHLDLDSDNDGCPDAIEGGGSFKHPNLNIGGSLSGGVDADGVPTVANGGQAIETSQDAAQQAIECDACHKDSSLFTDADADGVGDACDLDADNDGILDSAEGKTCVAPGTSLSNYTPLGTATGHDLNGQAVDTNIPGLNIAHSTTGDTPSYYSVWSGVPYAHTAFQGVAGDGNDNSTSATTTFIYTFNQPIINLVVDLRDLDAGGSADRYEKVKIEALYNGTAVTNKSVLTGSSVTTDANGYYENLVSDESEVSPGGSVVETYHALVNEIRVISTSNWGAGTVLYFSSGCVAVDTDGDGTPDYLDTDSDNDGCPDAIEGGGNFTSGDLDGNNTLGTPVDADGIPTAANGGQDVGTAQDATSKAPDCCKLVLALDTGAGTVGTPFTVPNILANDTLDDTTPTIGTDPGEVVISQEGTWPTGITLDPATGEVKVDGTVAAGTYPVEYRVCVNGTQPQLCKTETVTITVTDAPIDAADDNFTTTPVNGLTGGEAGDALTNDTLNGQPVTADKVDITTTTGPQGISVDADGKVQVPAGTPAGEYTVVYQICEKLNPSNCDTAEVKVKVAAPAADDTATGLPGQPVNVDVVANDGNVDPTTVQLVDPATGSPSTSVTVPGEGTWTVDPNTGKVTFAPEAGFTASPTPLNYQVTDNNGNTLTAMITITVSAAMDDTYATPANTPVNITPLTNDQSGAVMTSINGEPLTGSPQTIAVDNGTVQIDAGGNMTFVPNPGYTGTVRFPYTIRDNNGSTVTANININIKGGAPAKIPSTGIWSLLFLVGLMGLFSYRRRKQV